MQNLYDSINKLLKENKKPVDSITNVVMLRPNSTGSLAPCQVNAKRFIDMSKIINYDETYGLQQLPAGLKLVGDDFWVEGYTENGIEKFKYYTRPDTSVPTIDLIIRFNEQYDCWELV